MTNKRTYERFDAEEFQTCLEMSSLNFRQVDHDWTRELVYEAKSENDSFILRVYSSLDKRTGQARDKGSDAIRTVVLHADSGRPVLKEKRTNRIKTWCKNLRKKIDSLKNRQEEIEFCSKCGSIMVIRANKKTGNKFYGCTGYPDCKNTKSLE